MTKTGTSSTASKITIFFDIYYTSVLEEIFNFKSKIPASKTLGLRDHIIMHKSLNPQIKRCPRREIIIKPDPETLVHIIYGQVFVKIHVWGGLGIRNP